MDEHDNDALHAAFQAVLEARPEPPLPSVTEAAIAGGRRIRRRRAAFVTAGVFAVVASTATVAIGLSSAGGTGGERAPLPLAPVSTTRPTPHPTTPAPETSGTSTTHHTEVAPSASRLPASASGAMTASGSAHVADGPLPGSAHPHQGRGPEGPVPQK